MARRSGVEGHYRPRIRGVGLRLFGRAGLGAWSDCRSDARSDTGRRARASHRRRVALQRRHRARQLAESLAREAVMRAMRMHDYGGPEVLRYDELPDPVAGPGQLLVRVKATSVNPVDWKIRSGAARAMLTYPLPLVIGGDIA